MTRLAFGARSTRILPMKDNRRIGVLFVCMGNICRSPLAEGVFLHKLHERGLGARFMVDSCGTGDWHVGERPDPRVLGLASGRGVSLPSYARQVQEDDFSRFDLIVCMDEENLDHLLYMGAPREKVRLLMDFMPEPPTREVPDPYLDGPEAFELAYELIDAATDALIDALMDDAP